MSDTLGEARAKFHRSRQALVTQDGTRMLTTQEHLVMDLNAAIELITALEAALAESEQKVSMRADETRSYFVTGESMVPPDGAVAHSAEYFDGARYAIAIMVGEVTPWGVAALSERGAE